MQEKIVGAAEQVQGLELPLPHLSAIGNVPNVPIPIPSTSHTPSAYSQNKDATRGKVGSFTPRVSGPTNSVPIYMPSLASLPPFESYSSMVDEKQPLLCQCQGSSLHSLGIFLSMPSVLAVFLSLFYASFYLFFSCMCQGINAFDWYLKWSVEELQNSDPNEVAHLASEVNDVCARLDTVV